jgi:hypothetical protein
MALACILSGCVLATSLAQQCGHFMLTRPVSGLVLWVWHGVHCVGINQLKKTFVPTNGESALFQVLQHPLAALCGPAGDGLELLEAQRAVGQKLQGGVCSGHAVTPPATGKRNASR